MTLDRKWKAAIVAIAAMLVIGFALSRVPPESLLAPDDFPELGEDAQPEQRSPHVPEDEPEAASSAEVGNRPGGILQLPAPLLADPGSAPEAHVREAGEAELRERFNQAAIMLHAGEYEFAIKALHRVLEIAPRLPEAHVNMGFALLGEQAPAAAADFFASAIELNGYQANAYYGLAMALEALGDREAALGAMRSFIHLAGEAEQPYLARARAALWEWQAQAGEGEAPAEPPRGGGS